MEIPTAQPSSGSPSAAYPRWVTFERDNSSYGYGCDSSYLTGDPNTLATAHTTTGHQIQASLLLADPPASSHVCLQLQVGTKGAEARDTTVIAAHGDSVLVAATVVQDPTGNTPVSTTNHFVYRAGDAAAVPQRPPSLSLLPPYYIADKNYYSGRPRSRGLSSNATGIVRHGEDDIVVAELTMAAVAKDDTPELRAAELFLFRFGRWIVIKSPAIRNGDRKFGELHAHSFADAVVPVGDRMLCWVNLDRGLLLCDVFEERLVLEYVKLPVYPCRTWPSSAKRNVCATAGGSTLKLVDVFPRCCCGGEGTTDCERSDGACVVNTWTLRMSDMVWVKDGILDSSELWASGTYQGLPRLTLGNPLVSVDESHVVRFVMIEDMESCYDEKRLWKVMVDMRRKTIQSFLCHPGDEPEQDHCDPVIPSNVSCYFNSCPTSSSNGMPNSKGQSKVMEIVTSPVHVRDEDVAPQIIHGESSCVSSSMTAGNSKNCSALQFGDIRFEEKYRKNMGKFTSAGLLSKITFQGVALPKAKEKKSAGKYISIGSMEVEIEHPT